MLETEIKKLTAAIEVLTSQLQSAAPAPADPAETPAPAPAPEPKNFEVVTLEELTRKCLALSKDGHKAAIKEKLGEFGVTRLSEVSADDFAAFAKWVETVK